MQQYRVSVKQGTEIAASGQAAYAALPASACSLGAQGSDGPDRIARNVYDAAGQVLKVQKALGVTTANGFPATLQQDYASYGYTPNGQRSSLTDANGNKAAFAYDGFDRLARWSFPSKTSAGQVSTTDYETYGYDPNGNRTTFRKRDGSVLGFQYDALNRMIVKTVPERAGLTAAQTRDVFYAYDLRGLQTAARFDSLAGEGVTNGFDGFGRLVSSSTNMGGTVRTLSYLYDSDANRTRITHPDGGYIVYDYDGLDRMTVVTGNSGTELARFAYDKAGRRQSATSGGTAAVLARRDSGHHMNAVGFGRAQVDRAVRSVATVNHVATRMAIRGREQMLIDHFGGARSEGGTSGNAKNGISPYNPLRGTYMGAAEAMFGSDF